MTKPKQLRRKTSIKNKIALCCTLASFILFVPGISLPMLKIRSGGTVATPLTSDFSLEFFNSYNSILDTIHNLFIRNNKFVACMIFLFSIVVPLVKAGLFSYVLFSKNIIRKKVFNFIKSISKWAMCDVYVVAVFLTYMSTSGSSRRSVHEVLLRDNPVEVDVLVRTTSKLGVGFYYFLAYCLLALLSFHLYDDNEGRPPPLWHKH